MAREGKHNEALGLGPGGAEVTIIDGQAADSVIHAINGETSGTIIVSGAPA